MSLQIRYNSATDVADVVTVRQGDVAFSMSAEEGSVGMSKIVVDDTAGSLDYVGLRRMYAYETACQAHNQMIFNGYVQGREISRGPTEGPDEDVEIIGASRRWSVSLADTNSLLSRRLITGPDGNRLAETDIARIQWLLDSNDAYLSNPHDVWENPSPYVNTIGPIDMDAADLRGQTAHDVLNDCAQRSGKNWFARYYEADDTVPPTNAGSIALFYDFAISTVYSSTLRLTNVRADVDNVTTFAVLPDLVLSRDPSRVYSGIYLTYDGGTLYQQSTDVENLFQRRDAAVTNQNVKTAAKATALATRYLADAETEDDRIIASYVCAKQHVNDLREGQALQVKFAHLDTAAADYASGYVWMRCLRRTVRLLTDEFYQAEVELSPITIGPAVASHARLMRPNDNSYQGAGLYVLNWDYDGDNPQGGDGYDALVGYMAYDPVPKPGNGWVGLKMLGRGTVSIELKANAITTVDGSITTTWTILRNGVAVWSESTFSTGGLRSIQATVDASVSGIEVTGGDIITVRFSNSQGLGWTIPAGVGDGTHRLLVTGSLGPVVL